MCPAHDEVSCLLKNADIYAFMTPAAAMELDILLNGRKDNDKTYGYVPSGYWLRLWSSKEGRAPNIKTYVRKITVSGDRRSSLAHNYSGVRPEIMIINDVMAPHADTFEGLVKKNIGNIRESKRRGY